LVNNSVLYFKLLDLIHVCWLSELPPSSDDLVIQLLDPVTETELW